MNLLEKQNQLQKEAKQVLEDLKLLSFLSTFGKPELVGSIVTGLMTWRDIDMSIIVEPKEEDMWAIAQYIFKQENTYSVWVADYRIRVDSPFPKGLYVGVKYKKPEGEIWKIDIWLKQDVKDIQATNELMKKLDATNREIILQIKHQVADHPKYRKEIFSTDIYTAVLEKGVRNIEEFTSYIKDVGKSL